MPKSLKTKAAAQAQSLTFEFVAADPGAHEGELFRAVRITPNVSNGKPVVVLGRGAQWYERKALLNAARDLNWQQYRVEGRYDFYAQTYRDADDPDWKNGSLGWMNIFGLSLPEHRTNKPETQTVPDDPDVLWRFLGQTVVATLPRRRNDMGVLVYDIQGLWMTISSYRPGAITLRNAAQDDNGVRVGAIKHGFVNELAHGQAYEVDVTGRFWTDKVTGKTDWLDGGQRKALFIQRSLTQDFEEVRKQIAQGAAEMKATSQALSRAKAVDPTVGSFDDKQTSRQNLHDKAAGKEAGLLINVDGTKIDINKVPAGKYDVVVLNASGQRVSTHDIGITLARMPGEQLLRYYANHGYGLITVSVFERQTVAA